MMKRMLALLLALLLCLPALAETAPELEAPDAAELLSPFALALPEGVSAHTVPGGSSVTYVHDNGVTRAVATVLDRVPDPEGDHAAELARLMALFAPEAQEGTPLALTEGFHGLMAVTPDALDGMNDAQVDQVTVMVLWQTAERGELLILSAYDLSGVTDNAQTLLAMLLRAVTVEGAAVVESATSDE